MISQVRTDQLIISMYNAVERRVESVWVGCGGRVGRQCGRGGRGRVAGGRAGRRSGAPAAGGAAGQHAGAAAAGGARAARARLAPGARAPTRRRRAASEAPATHRYLHRFYTLNNVAVHCVVFILI